MRSAFWLPFFYFQQTRVNSLKSLVFHFAYEWNLTIIIVLIDQQFGLGSLLDLFYYYMAFISIYEIGYLVNDQLALKKEGRVRVGSIAKVTITLMVILRLLVFFAVTFHFNRQQDQFWWEWYAILVLIFAIHNIIENAALKAITFFQLAFFRFFTPLIFLISSGIIKPLFVPIIINYVLFRLLIYMDSKSIIHFNRNNNEFRVGYYLLMLGISVTLSFQADSLIPLAINAYYLSLVLGFALVSKLGFKLI